jgi:hypothetical protein
MERHFHAAILFGFEGLIEIGAVSEIGAAVGDKEGGIDFLLLNQFGQRLELTFWPLQSLRPFCTIEPMLTEIGPRRRRALRPRRTAAPP